VAQCGSMWLNVAQCGSMWLNVAQCTGAAHTVDGIVSRFPLQCMHA
jgi:hypothetical protein